MGTTLRSLRVWSVLVVGAFAASCSDDAADADDRPVSSPAPGETSETTSTSSAVSEATAPEEPRWATGDSDELFDQTVMHTFEIELSDEDLAILDADPAAEEYVEGSLTFGGETLDPIGVRYKGSVGAFLGCTAGPNPLAPSGPKSCTKLSMRLKINWTDPSTEFFGVRSVLLHAQNLDPTMMHERLGYWLFREMGVPASRSTHARVIVNGVYLGVFALTEDIDGRFTRENFDDGTGNLYKEVWPFDVDGAPTAPDLLLDGLETNEDDSPTTDIISEFAADLASAAPDDAIAVIEEWGDVDQLLRTFVVDRAIKNDDGALHWYCIPECAPHNFYWYEDPTSQEVSFIPWDLDNAFEALAPVSDVGGFIAIADPWGSITNDCQPFPFGSFGIPQRSAACDPLIGALSRLTSEYDQLWAEFLAGPFSDEQVTDLLDEWATQIEPAVAEAADLHDDAPSVDEWRAAIDQLQALLVTVRAGDGR